MTAARATYLASLCGLAIGLAGFPGNGRALELDLPGNARLVYENVTGPASYAFPTGPYADGALPTLQAQGNVSRQVFRLDGGGATTLQVFEPLKQQILGSGLEAQLDCDTDRCGGFDFRFTTEVVPAPDMHVDLTDYRFLSAWRGEEDDREYLSLLVSRSEMGGFIQLIRVSPARVEPLRITRGAVPQKPVTAAKPDSIGRGLEGLGFAILGDLTFETGSAKLGAGPFASLDALAVYLTANPNRRVALVGHTDTKGSLKNNIALSKRRAQSVLDRLVAEYDVSAEQLAAEGMGYLSPVASNLTPEGRDANRRVEVVLLNTD